MPLLLLFLACTRAPAPQPTVSQPAVVLISWDTTRADALGAWKQERSWRPDLPDPAVSTPIADRLAEQGVRFAWALAHAPTTLASHTSVMSGRDTHGSSVARNGYPVPKGLPLLAERYAAQGWDTIAVVGASTLDGEMGLSRGFRIYDDDVETKVRRRYEDNASRVTQRALTAASARRSDRPLLLFVHYFDPHSPWDSAPEAMHRAAVGEQRTTDPGPLVGPAKAGTLTDEASARARAAYAAEVTWTDQQTGLLLDGLRKQGVLDDALVVLFGDHGEALDDPGLHPYGHGMDADLAAIHVPLIVHGTGRFAVPKATVVQRQVRLLDIGTTVLAASDPKAAPLGAGEDLGLVWRAVAEGRSPAAAPASFAEATKPSHLEATGGWNNLPFDRSVAYDGHFLTVAPYLDQPPTLHALAAGQPRVAPDDGRSRDLVQQLAAWDRSAPPYRDVQLSIETRQALEALGYLE